MIKRVLKTIAICTTLFFALVVIAYGLLLLLTLHKVPLHAEVEAFLRPGPIVILPERNGFYYWKGLDAPAGENPIEYGQRVIAKLHGRSPTAVDSGAASAAQRLRLVHERKILCHSENRMPCLVLARQNAAQVRALANENAELMHRYAALLQFDQFTADMPILNPMDPIPSPVQGIDLFTLARTIDAVDISEGRSSDVLKRIAARVGFLRRIHANSTELIDRMVAEVLLVKDLQFLVEVAVAKPDSISRDAVVQVSAITARLWLA
jgi:hypothetical protein